MPHAGHLVDRAQLLFVSQATDDDIEQYTSGECHVFAVALHRMLGWQMCAVLDYGEPYWEDPVDPDNFIPAVCHIFVVDPDGHAWDVMGIRKREDIRDETESWCSISDPVEEDLFSELDLAVYVGVWGEDADGDPVDRPLHAFSAEDVQEATEKALRIFAGHPAFEEARAKMGLALPKM
jgi:hypothetical protein